jgi:hypothetical protein
MRAWMAGKSLTPALSREKEAELMAIARREA